jgi:PAS domain S-box-containing protein
MQLLSRTIVLIDDSSEDRATYRRYLLQKPEYGYTVIEAESGQTGLKLCQQLNPDAIVLDYQLPDLNGIEFIQQLRSRNGNPAIVFLTGQGNEAIAVEAMKSGAQDYLVKSGLTGDYLCHTLKSAIEKHQLQQQILHSREQWNRDRKQFERQLQQQLAEIEAIYATAPVGLCFIDTELRFIRINQHLAEINGFSAEQHIGRTLRDILPDQADNLEPLYRQVLETGIAIENLEIRGTNSAQPGIERHWLISLHPFNLPNQAVSGVNVFVLEISDRKQTELELSDSQQQLSSLVTQLQLQTEDLSRANRIKDEFLAVLSHELRTPLNPILGWSKLLQQRKFSDAQSLEALKTIERNARLQTQLVDELLDVAKILRGKLALNVSPVHLEQVIQTVLRTMHLAAEAKSIQIEVSLEALLSPMMGDAGRLQQVIWNLLSNAVKFTPKDGKIEVHLTQLDGQAQITVSDTGKGIASSFMPYVFDYFRQADGATTRHFGGLGLGLAIARHIIEMHGGAIYAMSAGEGRGSTFTIHLPLNPVAVKEAMLPTELHLQDVRILVVDDDADSCQFLAFLLEQEGAIVIPVSSALEALDQFEQSAPDILVSDIGMPEIDGVMLIQQVRERSPIPAIALTAYAGEANRQRAIAAGFQWQLSKPIDPTELTTVVARLLQTG